MQSSLTYPWYIARLQIAMSYKKYFAFGINAHAMHCLWIIQAYISGLIKLGVGIKRIMWCNL